MDRKKLAGRTAEAQSAEYLRRKGYVILTLNYACRGGEIDIVAEQPAGSKLFGIGRKRGGYIVFAEVKMRSSRDYGEAREAVGWRKQRRIRLAAGVYLSEHQTALQPRFDVIEAYPYGDGFEFNHIENAFE